MKIKTLLLIAFSALMLTACGNADSSDTHIPADVSTTTTTVTTTTTTSEPTTTTTTTTSSTDTASEPTVTTTTATTSSSATTSQPTTSDVTTSKATTTTKKKPTSTTTTTTTAKKTTTTTTTTAKPVDSGQYAITGIDASYNRLRKGYPTDEDIQIIEQDLCNYLMENFDGKVGTIEVDYNGPFSEILVEKLGLNPNGGKSSFYVSKPLDCAIDPSATFEEDAHLNRSENNQWFCGDSDLTPEKEYYWNLLFRSSCYGLVEGSVESAYWYFDSKSYPEGGRHTDYYFKICRKESFDKLVGFPVYYIWCCTPSDVCTIHSY